MITNADAGIEFPSLDIPFHYIYTNNHSLLLHHDTYKKPFPPLPQFPTPPSKMLMHHRPPTPMPRREQHAAMPTLVLRVLQAMNQIRDAAEEENAADD